MSPERGTAHLARARGTLGVTLALLLATVAALTLQYSRTFSVIDVESRHLIQAEMAGLLDRYRMGGEAELVRFIRQSRSADRRESLYLLRGADGRLLAGNLSRWPAGAVRDGWHVLTLPEAWSDNAGVRQIDAELITLSSGSRLLVGHVADGRDRLRARFLEVLASSVLVTLVLGLAFGWWIGLRARRFVQHAASSGERFLAGHLDERLPVTGRGDEYDRLAEVVNACFAEVERVIASLRAATDGLAHDLKTPLTRMKARAELAMLREASPGAEFLSATTRDIDALLKLINDLLAVARIDALTADMLEPVDLAHIAREAIELYEPVAEDHGREIVGTLESIEVRAVRTLLVQATCNLIDNALKHAAEAGAILIRTAAVADGAALSVSDRGPGIAERDRARALDRLVRLDSSRSSEGSGLGLSIVDAVVRAHGGSVSLDDNHPGLTVTLIIPAQDTAATSRRPPHRISEEVG